GGKSLNAAIAELLPSIIKESKKVIFNGDNYTEEWHREAEKRGLPNIRNTVDSLPVILRKDSVDLFTKYRVYSDGELKSRFNILTESYVKTVAIEAKLTRFMGQTMILPACLRYQGEVAIAVNATKAAGVDNTAQATLLKTLMNGINDLQKSLSDLDHAIGHHAEGELIDHAKNSRDKIIP